MTSTLIPVARGAVKKWAKVIDQTRCIGCHACSTACKSENEVPLSVNRTYVKSVDVGTFPAVGRSFQVTRCNQCDEPPCVFACPTAAMYRRDDGIVDFDKTACIGCKACIAACPYDAIFINPSDNSAEKCNFCAQRIDVGLEPACVVVCPAEAILVGDLADPSSKVARIAARDVVAVRRPEKLTKPKLFYKGASRATLDPLAARRPEGGLYMWSEQGEGLPRPASGANNAAAALLSYDVPHKAPWGFLVSLYTWTKGVATGAYLVPLLLIQGGWLFGDSPLWAFGAPVLAGVFLAITGGILIVDLKHPERFFMIFTRPQWRSWLTRGAFIIAAYSTVLALHFVASWTGRGEVREALRVPGASLAAATAVYTAFLFAQSKARDLWQSSFLAPQLLVQSLLAGSASLLPLSSFVFHEAEGALAVSVAMASAAHLLFVLGEVAIVHPSAHARQAVAEMTRGAHRASFTAGVALTIVGLFAPWLGSAAALAALLGLLAYEHAYVQAAQAVPLA